MCMHSCATAWRTKPIAGYMQRHNARYTCVFQDALSFPEADTTKIQAGQGDYEGMSPLGSALGFPQIAADWGPLDEGASCSSSVGHSLEAQREDVSTTEDAASTADAGSVADEATTADGADHHGGVKEDRWEEVKGATSKSKGKVLPIKLKDSRSNAGRPSTREKSRLGNPNNVVEVPRSRGNAGLHGNGGKYRLGNAGNVVEAPRPRGNGGLHGNGGESKRGNASNVLEVLRPKAH